MADGLRAWMLEALEETLALVPVEVEATTGRTWAGWRQNAERAG